eukprot:m.68072 g.68072  ORF g.68072 m.68072 type:complete len:93 (-) comp12187_c0_seq1:6729-7007(-)
MSACSHSVSLHPSRIGTSSANADSDHEFTLNDFALTLIESSLCTLWPPCVVQPSTSQLFLSGVTLTFSPPNNGQSATATQQSCCIVLPCYGA